MRASNGGRQAIYSIAHIWAWNPKRSSPCSIIFPFECGSDILFLSYHESSLVAYIIPMLILLATACLCITQPNLWTQNVVSSDSARWQNILESSPPRHATIDRPWRELGWGWVRRGYPLVYICIKKNDPIIFAMPTRVLLPVVIYRRNRLFGWVLCRGRKEKHSKDTLIDYTKIVWGNSRWAVQYRRHRTSTTTTTTTVVYVHLYMHCDLHNNPPIQLIEVCQPASQSL